MLPPRGRLTSRNGRKVIIMAAVATRITDVARTVRKVGSRVLLGEEAPRIGRLWSQGGPRRSSRLRT